ncbi:MAG: DUF116 domain-containing protein [Sulfuricellaceae bacterium]
MQDAAWNQAFDRQWLRRHARGEAPALLRFHRSRPGVSLGRHQDPWREVRLDYCRDKGIPILRRSSGGGTLYLDENQLGFSLILPAIDAPLATLLERFARAIGQGVAALGADADFAFPNDLERDGRKLAAVFAAEEDGSLLLHGTLLLRADVRTMLEALRVPTEKLSPDGLAAARDRVAPLADFLTPLPPLPALQTALTDSLATAFGLNLAAPADLPPAVAEDFTLPPPPTGCEALWKAAGGHLYCRLEVADGRCRRAAFSGDVHLRPGDWLENLAAHLAGQPLERLETAAAAFCARHPVEGAGFSADDARHALRLALNQHRAAAELGLSPDQAGALMLFGSETAPLDTLARASVMLVPYCAKPAWCAFRHQDGCAECGKCEVGDAYRLGRERGMQVTTITHYEQLESTLAKMKKEKVAGYVGMCCSQFFRKRHRAFLGAGIPALLMDIQGANCYELKQEHAAYAGTFQAEARLDAELLQKVVQFIPFREAK